MKMLLKIGWTALMATVVLLNCTESIQHTNDVSDVSFNQDGNGNVDTIIGGQTRHDIVMEKGNEVENDVSNAEDHDIGVHARYSGDSTVKQSNEESEACENNGHRASCWRQTLHVAVVSCGDRVEETLVMFKSAVLFSSSHLVFHIFTEPEFISLFEQQLDAWPRMYRKQITYRIYNISFPSTEHIAAADWKKLDKPCACQRLFLPNLLPGVDSVLYVDTDIVFLSAVDGAWKFFHKFNTTQLAALSPEHEKKSIGWYNRFARHPYYGDTGLNSGVMLMNLTRLRMSPWLQSIYRYYIEYKKKIVFGDQDLINIYFHHYPEQLLVLSCEMNYRSDHCMYNNNCLQAGISGAVVLHGSRRVWFNDKQPAFKAVYTAFLEHDLAGHTESLLTSTASHLQKANSSRCGNFPHLFTKQLQTLINDSQIPLT